MELNHKIAAIPKIMYGTAWKEAATEILVTTAIEAGFRAIDTANQRKHYNEAAVGNAITKALTTNLRRDELFLQTKFTYKDGQDERIPYDPKADFKTQVRQSFQSSLDHLQVEYIDSYLLHGPSTHVGLAEADWQIWQEMEALQKEKKVIYLGVSNIALQQLKLLFEKAEIKPTFVQNRCFAQQRWDKEVRIFCKQNNIIYQGFSLLTANSFLIPKINIIAKKMNKTPAQIIFKFSQQRGMLPLTGTNNKIHMAEDLALDFTLNDNDLNFIENIVIQ